MRIADSNWMQIEKYLERDDRCVLPIGSTEQHGYLSLCVDAILAERVAIEAAEPTGVPVYPVMPFGSAPYYAAYPGSISLRVETLLAVVRDFIDSVHQAGFRRILIVNGHGGNAAVGNLARDLMAEKPGLCIKFHSWWNGPEVMAKAHELEPNPSHANWFENFPWTRLAGVEMPKAAKPVPDISLVNLSSPQQARELLGDGVYGAAYQIADAAMAELWAVGVEETRQQLEAGWPTPS
ncbi:MAG: creatininase family protein [Planctomycetota bacterium]|jgi:creatinine amidohydrolase